MGLSYLRKSGACRAVGLAKAGPSAVEVLHSGSGSKISIPFGIAPLVRIAFIRGSLFG
jgi:hypothetical protein